MARMELTSPSRLANIGDFIESGLILLIKGSIAYALYAFMYDCSSIVGPLLEGIPTDVDWQL